MEQNYLKKIADFGKRDKRLVTAGGFLVVVFLLNQLIFSSQKIALEDCLDGKCVISQLEKPQLSKENSLFYLDDILNNTPSGYYRLTFQTKSDQEERVTIKLSTYAEKNKTIGEMMIGASEKPQNQELFFHLPEGFGSLLFEKEKIGLGGDIFVKGVGISKLNVNNAEDFASMQKTIVGETKIGALVIDRLNDSADSFLMLQEPKMILGQIFKAESAHISGIFLKMDVVKNTLASNRDYALSLWEAYCEEEDCQTQGKAITRISFSVAEDLERYRQNDGSFLFPLYANVEKGKKYFVGIDNSGVKADRTNYLGLRGGREGAYPDGSAAMRIDKKLYKIGGDLSFAVRGADVDIQEGKRVLNGAKIESLGKKQGKYSYSSKGEIIDILDFSGVFPGVNFDGERRVMVSDFEKDAFLTYEVNTLFPMQKMRFSAEQTKNNWKRVKVEYSFDREKWINIPYENGFGDGSFQNFDEDLIGNESEAEALLEAGGESKKEEENLEIQVFDFEIIPVGEKETIHFRISPDPEDFRNGRYFSIKNLNIVADLKMK